MGSSCTGIYRYRQVGRYIQPSPVTIRFQRIESIQCRPFLCNDRQILLAEDVKIYLIVWLRIKCLRRIYKIWNIQQPERFSDRHRE